MVSARRTKPSYKTHRPQKIEGDPVMYYPEIVFDAVEKTGALGPHPKAPRRLPGAYYVAAVLGNA